MIKDRYNALAEEFIRHHRKENPSKLRFAMHGKNPGFDVDLAITQIEAANKCKSKISFFLNQQSFIIPDTSLAEQSSNQYVALFHALLIGKGKFVLDLTAGLGIDAFTLALAGNDVTAIEMIPFRAEILKHNVEILGINNFNVYENEAMKWLSDNPSARFDWIFIDPARRSEANVRSFLLEDSSPDVISNQHILLKHADDVLIKASPLLDVSRTIASFSNIKSIYIVSYKGECKELLIHLNRSSLSGNSLINVIDISGTSDYNPNFLQINYSFTAPCSEFSDVRIYADEDYITKGKYIYELGAGMRKLRCASELLKHYPGIKSLSRQSYIYISDNLYSEFPGRISEIYAIPNGKELQKLLKGSKFRVVSSDYPLSADTLRKKYSIGEGMSDCAIFTHLETGKYITLLTHRVQNEY